MKNARAFTLVELMIVIGVVAVALAIVTTGTRAGDEDDDIKKNNNQLRGIHQSMVIFASSNNTYLPGLSSQGAALDDSETNTGKSGSGAAPAARLWILLNGQFVPPNLIINPRGVETMTQWKKGKLTTEHFSYALLQIDNPKDDAGRLAEWRDNANSQAIMLGDRNTGRDNADTKVKSVWLQREGKWAGGLVWGDNHAIHATNHRDLVTRYQSIVTQGDNIFATAPADDPKVTEAAKTPDSNAMLYCD